MRATIPLAATVGLATLAASVTQAAPSQYRCIVEHAAGAQAPRRLSDDWANSSASLP
jgi:hypothetical protein